MTPSLPSLPVVQNIVLTGFMGSGKTTVGQLLAQTIGWTFADLDVAVERRVGSSVPAIFAERGEPFFRQSEARALGELLQRQQQVIALGGGAPTSAETRDVLLQAEGVAVVHLHAPFPLLFERCVAQARDPQATARPLLGEREAAADRYQQRLQFYAAVATHRVDVNDLSPQSVADILARQVGFAPDSMP